MSRGMLTDEIKELSKELLGYEIDQKELRLMPYLHFESINEQKFDRSRCDREEADIIYKWIEKGFLKTTSGAPWQRFTFIDPKFYAAVSEIMFIGYVDLREKEVA